jgi:glycosyltransferase involved in cell wall biosynthesis
MLLSIVVPCYNEEKNIPLLLERFNSSVKDNKEIEVILVNNGSKDNSKEVLKELIPKYKFAKTVEVKVNQGYGYGILYGLSHAKGDFIGWTHADLQTDPYDIIKALKLIKTYNYDKKLFIKGLRKNRPLFDTIFTVGMSFFETIYLKKILWDINAQPNIFHKDFYKSWNNPPHDFSLDLFALYTARKQNLKIIRFDVNFPERIHGHSSWNTGFKEKIKFIKRTLDYSFKLKKELSE